MSNFFFQSQQNNKKKIFFPKKTYVLGTQKHLGENVLIKKKKNLDIPLSRVTVALFFCKI